MVFLPAGVPCHAPQGRTACRRPTRAWRNLLLVILGSLLGCGLAFACPAPDAPVVTMSPGPTKGSVTLHWTPGANVASYGIWVTNEAGDNLGMGYGPLAPDTSSYTIVPRSNTLLYCEVSAINDCGPDPWPASHQVSTTRFPLYVHLDAPRLRGRAGNARAVLTWNAVPTADRYAVFQSDSPNGPWG